MNRSYFVALVQNLITSYDGEFEKIRNTRRLVSPLDTLVRFVNCRTVPPTVDVVTIADYERRTAGAPDYLKMRINAYLAQASDMPNVFVVETLFPYGGASFHLLVKFTRASSGEVVALSAICPAW
jgi:hypothetical protein